MINIFLSNLLNHFYIQNNIYNLIEINVIFLNLNKNNENKYNKKLLIFFIINN